MRTNQSGQPASAGKAKKGAIQRIINLGTLAAQFHDGKPAFDLPACDWKKFNCELSKE